MGARNTRSTSGREQRESESSARQASTDIIDWLRERGALTDLGAIEVQATLRQLSRSLAEGSITQHFAELVVDKLAHHHVDLLLERVAQTEQKKRKKP